MKKTLATVAGAMTALGVFAQGKVWMFNNNLILDSSGAPAGPATGGTYEAELVIDSGIPGQTAPVAIAESICPVNQGYFNGPGSTGIFRFDGTQGTPTVPPSLITYQVEAWNNAASYAAAAATPGDQYGISAVNSYALGSDNINLPSPPEALNFATFQMVTGIPEPTTLTLGAMGLSAVLMFRRRTQRLIASVKTSWEQEADAI
jgi:hypothetical protein